MIVIWKKNGLRLRVLGLKEGHEGEKRYVVCKETATNPKMGQFSVRVDDTLADFR